MASIELKKLWRVVTTLLRRAHRALPASNEPERITQEKEFEEYMAHNELGLALDVLEEIGNSTICRGRIWRDLERAAGLMELHDRAKRFRSRFMATKPFSD